MARTIEEIRGTISAARDSVWVVEDSISKIAGGQTPNEELEGNIERNVAHLKLVTSNQEIIDSNENIADLLAAITAGEAKLQEDIWG